MSTHRKEAAMITDIVLHSPSNENVRTELRDVVDEGFKGLEATVPLAGKTIKDRIDRWVRSPDFIKVIDTMVRDHAKAIVIEVLAEKDAGLEAAVRRIVDERWETEVSRVAHDLLTTKLADLKRRLT